MSYGTSRWGVLVSAGVTPALFAVLLGLAACQPGEVTVVDPDGSDGGPSLGTLVAQVELGGGDSALADSLGWEAGVPGARVRILRNGTAEWLEAETDTSGIVVFEELESGQYYTYVERMIPRSEAASLSGTVRGFGDGALLRVTADTVHHGYRLRTSRRAGLVISEVSNAGPPPWEVPGGGFSSAANNFFEVYNPTDRTIYLDGLIFGRFPIGFFCDGCANSCALGEPVRTDSTGLYFNHLLAFPGSGGDYPIEPGETKLVAGAAQDNRNLHEDMLDLRNADFEIGGSNLADNPAVPDMVNNGTRQLLPVQLGPTTTLFFLSDPFDPSDYPITWRDVRGNGYRKIPLDLVIDVVTFKYVWPEFDAEHPRCDPLIHPSIDGFPGGYLVSGSEGRDKSAQREVLTIRDGIPILMDTNTSAADFSIMRYTPGELPQQ